MSVSTARSPPGRLDFLDRGCVFAVPDDPDDGSTLKFFCHTLVLLTPTKARDQGKKELDTNLIKMTSLQKG